MLTTALINKELRSMKIQETKLLASLEILKNMSPAQELAVELHQKCCTRNEKCVFRYEPSWNSLEHKKWLEKAEILLKITTAETVLNVLWITKD